MNQGSSLTRILVITVLLAGCSSAGTPVPTPTRTVEPTPLPNLTQVLLPTATLATVRTPLLCPTGYTTYLDNDLGLSSCYPQGWVVSRSQDQENEVVRVSFSPPAGTTGAGLRFVSVTVSPAMPFFTDQGFLQEISNWLLLEYYDRMLFEPQIVLVDDHKAVEVAYEARVVLGREVARVTRWVTALRAHDRRWFIDVAGRTQYRDELERLRAQFLAHFHVAPLSSGE